MLFKRYLFLAACILVYIFGFIGYFTFARAQIESRFREERIKFNVEGVVLTSTNAITATPPPPVASGSGQTTSAPMPPDAPASAAPAGDVPPADTNIIIGPVPPPSPDGTTNAPAPSDSGSAPMAPSSTMNDSRQTISSFLVRAAYQPSKGLAVQAPTLEPAHSLPPTPAPPAPPVTAPATNAATNAVSSVNTATTNAATSSISSTNAASITAAEPGVVRPVAVGASVIVLGYHQFVGPGESSKNPYVMKQDVFESEMKYLKDNGYHVIPLSDVVRFVKHEIGVPPNSVAITIDDGYKSAINWAAPVLKKYGYPWTYFVYPDFITVNEGKGAASWNDLLALQADGVDVESHSMTHPFLTHKTQKFKGPRHVLTPEEYDQFLTDETAGSKTLLEQKLGKTIRYLAYPYGDYNKQVETKAVGAGYEAIFTVADNPIHASTDIYSMGRYVITQPVEKAFASYLREGALGLAEADPAPGATISNPRPVITAVLGYAGTLDPASIETDVRDFGAVKHDFDPKTCTVRLYLPRDLIQPVNLVSIHVKDAQTGQVMVANWHFNYAPAGGGDVTHPPIAPVTNAAPALTNAPASAPEPPPAAETNAPAAVRNESPPLKSVNSSPSASSKVH